MNDKKRVNQSNDAVDFDRSPIKTVDGEGPDSTDPPETDKDSELILQAISQLQAVRVPGRGKLSLNEAVAAAINQGRAFKLWRESGEPVGEIEVWVEGRRVMSVLPESPAELQEFSFKVPSPDTAVLQLTTQANGEKAVLYNLRLRDVPPEGLSHTEGWPNGQSILLNITCKLRAAAAAAKAARGFPLSASGRVEEFCIRIAINPHTSETSSVEAEKPSHRQEPGPTGGDSSAHDHEKLNVKGASTGSSLVKAAMAASFFVCLILLIGQLGFRTPLCGASGQQSATSQAGNSSSAAAQAEVGAATEVATVNPVDVSRTRLPGSQSKNGRAKPGGTTTALLSQTLARNSDIARKSKLTVASHHTAPKEAVDGAPLAFEHASLSPWQVSVYPKLAALKNFYVKLDNQTAEPATLENFRVSFVQALEASDRFKVLGATDQLQADGVISLRFESSEPCLGVIFVNVNGPDGKFLWQDFAWETPRACLTLPDNGQNNSFSDASVALVNRLKTTIKLAQEVAKRTELFAEGD